jgi:arsenate reductase-like glutaredoxin family protein
VSASKKLGRTEALAMAYQVQRLVAAKGKKVTSLDLTQEQLSEAVLASLLLGPTGNMRAPTLRVGQTLLIGYNEQAFAEVFG